MKRFALPALALLSSLTASAQAPTITALSPVRNAVSAPRAAPVAVTFSQPMQNTAATQQAVRVFSQQRGGLMFGATRGAATVSGNVISFDPANEFKPGETVFITTTTSATATNGIPLAAGHVHQFTTAVGGTGRGTFVPHPITPEVSVGRNPSGVATGDVDGDGDLDLVTANANIGGPGTVSVRLNDGTGAFSGTTEVLVGTQPLSVVVGDVDTDGDLDLLASNLDDHTVSIRLNDGTGAFSGTTNVSVDNGPFGLTVGDVDGDGDLDLLTANASAGTVSIRLNNGMGRFSGTALANWASSAHSVVVGDVDEDGDLDLLVANSNSDVRVIQNYGNGTFSGVSASVTVGTDPYHITAGDVDGDGDLDLVTANFSDGTVSVRTNNGSGSFSGTANLVVGGLPVSVALGDVDADGDLDLLVANAGIGFNTVSVLANDGMGTFGGTTYVSVGTQPQSVVMGDIDSDGDLDILTVSPNDTTVSVRLNGGTGPTLATAPALAEAAPDVYPNPAPDGRFILRATQPGAHYAVLDAVGRTVATGALTGSETALDLRQQPSGLYLLRLTGPDGRTATRRLVR